MNSKRFDQFNKRVEAVYRAVHLHQTLAEIGREIGVKHVQSVSRLITRAEKDERVMRSVAARAGYEMRKEDEVFEEIYRCQR